MAVMLKDALKTPGELLGVTSETQSKESAKGTMYTATVAPKAPVVIIGKAVDATSEKGTAFRYPVVSENGLSFNVKIMGALRKFPMFTSVILVNVTSGIIPNSNYLWFNADDMVTGKGSVLNAEK